MATGVPNLWVRRFWSGWSGRSSATRDAHAPRPSASPAPPTVLVVDDDADVLELAHELLIRAGFRVLAADGGARALEIFREHQAEIDVVVLDLHMPEVDGDVAFREIRGMRADARIVIASGYPERMASETFEATGRADGYLAKPYLPDTLIQRVREVLSA